MSAPEVDFVLAQLQSIAANQPNDHPLLRVDRDDSEVYETGDSVDMSDPMRERTEYLKRANYVGATLADSDRSLIGTEAHYKVERVVRCRVEGMHHDKWGEIDPTGSKGVVFGGPDSGLVGQCIDALDDEVHFPSVPGSGVNYLNLRVINDDPQSGEYADFYRFAFDCVLDGFRDRT